MKCTNSLFLFVYLCFVCSRVLAVVPSPEEMQRRDAWLATQMTETADSLPFSFVYDKAASRDLIGSWKISRSREEQEENRSRQVWKALDGPTGLAVRCEIVSWRDFPVVEWTLYFQNTSQSDTPILQDILPLDFCWAAGKEEKHTLHYSYGDGRGVESYRPMSMEVPSDQPVAFAPYGGRPTDQNFPYFNLSSSEGGLIAVVGWSGQWKMQMQTEQQKGTHLRAGQELTHFKLLPGEQVRSPKMVLLFYDGDWLRGQNLWRRWMMEHNLPRLAGQPLPPLLEAASSQYYGEMTQATEETQIMFIDRYLEEGIQLDYWWMDAGWYRIEPKWGGLVVDQWEPDPARFPRGLRPISDHAHDRGVKTIVWFEPEHIWTGSWLYENRPQWLLQPPKVPGIEQTINQGQRLEGRYLLDLGRAEARNWVFQKYATLIREQGIDLYRQDFNIEPLLFWRANDAGDRQGITEIRYIEGYLQFWDDLLALKPDMLIDTCSSGGRRIDLETLQRSVPLWRSDYAYEPVGMQCHSYGLFFWVPYFGSGALTLDRYHFRSNTYPSIVLNCDARNTNLDYELMRTLLAQWREFAPDYRGDYYPLTPYATGEDIWLAWQFDRPEEGRGFIQAFRRPRNSFYGIDLKLHGLMPETAYELTNVDTGQTLRLTGKELREKGLPVEIPEQPGAAVIRYHAVSLNP